MAELSDMTKAAIDNMKADYDELFRLRKENEELREALTTALEHLNNHAPELARIALLAKND